MPLSRSKLRAALAARQPPSTWVPVIWPARWSASKPAVRRSRQSSIPAATRKPRSGGSFRTNRLKVAAAVI